MSDQFCRFPKCCCKHNQIGPSLDVPEESWKRIHGFQLPLHFQQLLSWLLLFFTLFYVHCILIPSLPSNNFQIPLHIMFAFLSLILIPFMLITSLCDSQDTGKKSVEEDAVNCHWCNIVLSSPRTKHCRLCNKCVEGFDHHCKWLNQCIGQKNYLYFIISILSAFFLSIVVSILCIVEFVLCYTCDTTADTWQTHCIHPHFLNMPLSLTTFTVINAIFFLLSVVAASLLAHLISFHIYIRWNGWTTYEYIKLQLENLSNSDTSISYLVNKQSLDSKKKKKFWTNCPCFFCYSNSPQLTTTDIDNTSSKPRPMIKLPFFAKYAQKKLPEIVRTSPTLNSSVET